VRRAVLAKIVPNVAKMFVQLHFISTALRESSNVIGYGKNR